MSLSPKTHADAPQQKLAGSRSLPSVAQHVDADKRKAKADDSGSRFVNLEQPVGVGRQGA